MNKITTVVIINDFNYINGGAAKVAIETARMLVEKGIKVYFFSADSQEKDKIEKVEYITTYQKASLDDKNKIRGAINGIWNKKAYQKLGELLDLLDREKTIIHIHGWMKALSSSIFKVIEKKKFKQVVTYHDYFSYCPNGGLYNYQKNEICYLKPLSWKCIKCNCDSRNYMLKLYRLIRQFVQNKIVKINEINKNIISISDFSYQILKNSISQQANIKRIYNPIEKIDKEDEITDLSQNDYYLFVGRISKEKGIEYFCEAITQMGAKGIIVGDGPEKENLEKKYKNIEFTGWKNQKEVKKYMKNAKALIFPSIWYEGAPLTILEAQMIGLPVIVSDCCAGIEFVADKKLIFKNKDVEDLKEKIIILEKEIKEISKKIIKETNEKYNEAYIYKLLEFYENIGAKDES